MTMLTVTAEIESWALRRPFRISGHVFETSDVLVVTARRGGHEGRGEAAGVYYLGETAPGLLAQARAAADAVCAADTRMALQALLPPGGARNAIDCALWALEAAEAGRPVWQLAGVAPPRALVTTFTLGADQPAEMAEGARAVPDARMLKLKLSGETEIDIERVRAVRAARPGVWMGVDANQGFTPETIAPLLPVLVEAEVKLIEQPFRRGAEADMRAVAWPIPTAADESCLDYAELERMPGLFDIVNIKLDKSGGLTEALAMAGRARALGLGVMVGNMVGTSLSMAPAFVLGQVCDINDLDGVYFLARDRAPGIRYVDGMIECAPAVWGGGQEARAA